MAVAADVSTTINGAGEAPAQSAPPMVADPHAQAAAQTVREKFLPVTRHALLDRLTRPELWPNGDAAQARRFLRYLDYWRHHAYTMKLLEIEQTYEPFSPDIRPVAHAHVQPGRARDDAQAAGGANDRALAAGQLHARRSAAVPHHSDQGVPLRVGPAGRHQGLRGDPDLLPRGHHHHRAPARHQEGLHRLERGEGAGVPAPVHPLQAQALRAARAGGDEGAEDRSHRRRPTS